MKSIVFLMLFLSACTDASWDAHVSSYNETHIVDCYSGGEKIFNAETTGKVAFLEGGGWAFRTNDGRFIQTFADCFVWRKKWKFMKSRGNENPDSPQ